MALTTPAAQQLLVRIMTPKLERMAFLGGGSRECEKLARAISSSIVQWFKIMGTDAIDHVESMVVTQVNTSGGSGTGQGACVQFTGRIV